MVKSYRDKLDDPRWQKKRLEILDREDFTCQNCGAKNITLHVHHSYYERGLDPWEYPSESLKCLCKDCHAEIEECKAKVGSLLFCISPRELKEVFQSLLILSEIGERCGSDLHGALGYLLHHSLEFEHGLGLSLDLIASPVGDPQYAGKWWLKEPQSQQEFYINEMRRAKTIAMLDVVQ